MIGTCSFPQVLPECSRCWWGWRGEDRLPKGGAGRVFASQLHPWLCVFQADGHSAKVGLGIPWEPGLCLQSPPVAGRPFQPSPLGDTKGRARAVPVSGRGCSPRTLCWSKADPPHSLLGSESRWSCRLSHAGPLGLLPRKPPEETHGSSCGGCPGGPGRLTRVWKMPLDPEAQSGSRSYGLLQGDLGRAAACPQALLASVSIREWWHRVLMSRHSHQS